MLITLLLPNELLAKSNKNFDKIISDNSSTLFKRGKEIFRYDTFGDESFWGGALRLHQAIAGADNGGVGPGVSPNTALAVGLKVDVDALPSEIITALENGQVDLDDPATTLALLQLNAVVGVTGIFDNSGTLNSMGIQCALCHSIVDDSFAPGIGKRLDGWANRDLNVGTIISLAPDLSPFTELLGVDESFVRTVLSAWGPGKFDATLLMDGKGFRDDGKTAATLIPPAFGLPGVNLHTWTGWGSVAHWNAFVAILEMGGSGIFYDPRLKNAEKFPIAAAAGFDNVRTDDDRVTAKLPPLHFYQLTIPAPQPPKNSFNNRKALLGKAVFMGKAKCAECHVPPIYTEPGWNLHTAEQIGIDDFQAKRSPDEGYRTSPLAGLWTHSKGGYYHDGRFASLLDVVEHYNSTFNLQLTDNEKSYLVEFLKSI